MRRDIFNKLPNDFKWLCSREDKRDLEIENDENESDNDSSTSRQDKSKHNDLDEEITNVNNMASIKDLLKEILASQNFNSHKLDSLIKENKELKQTLKVYKAKTDELTDKVENMTGDINLLKQEKFSNFIIILGVPICSPDKIDDEVFKIFEKINVNVERKDILETRIMDSKKNSEGNKSSYPILVKLLSNSIKKEILGKKKQHGALRVKDVYETVKHDREIYINYYLTQYNMNLLKNAKILKTTYEFKYVWFGNNAVYAQKSDNKKAVRILTERDINYLKKSQRGKNNTNV